MTLKESQELHLTYTFLCLLCARPLSQHWECNPDQTLTGPCLMELQNRRHRNTSMEILFPRGFLQFICGSRYQLWHVPWKGGILVLKGFITGQSGVMRVSKYCPWWGNDAQTEIFRMNRLNMRWKSALIWGNVRCKDPAKMTWSMKIM